MPPSAGTSIPSTGPTTSFAASRCSGRFWRWNAMASCRLHRSLQLAIAFHRQKRPEQRDAANEVVGPVDGIDVPADGGIAGLGAELLANHAVVRIAVREPRSDGALDLLVGGGHERSVRLGRDLEIAPEKTNGRFVRLVARCQREVDPAAELRFRASPQRRRLRGPAARATRSASRPMKSTSLSRSTANPRPA